MNIKMIPDSGSGFVICKGKKAVTQNNPTGQFVVPIINVNDSYHAFEVGTSIIKNANAERGSKYFLNGNRFKAKRIKPDKFIN